MRTIFPEKYEFRGMRLQTNKYKQANWKWIQLHPCCILYISSYLFFGNIKKQGKRNAKKEKATKAHTKENKINNKENRGIKDSKNNNKIDISRKYRKKKQRQRERERKKQNKISKIKRARKKETLKKGSIATTRIS